jgi:1,4-alpha-glucan branching enzyme
MLAEGTRIENLNVGFDLDYGWDYYAKLKRLYKGEIPLSQLYDSNESEYASLPSGKHKLRFTTNHDESGWDATPTGLFGGERGAMSAFALTITLGGSPLIYSTQEIGYTQRVPFFTFTNINWNQNPEIFDEYQTLMRVYTSSEALKKGRLQTFDNNPDVACHYRLEGNESVLTIVNIRNTSKILTVPQQFIGNEWKNLMDNTNFNLQTSIQLEPFQYLIIGK